MSLRHRIDRSIRSLSLTGKVILYILIAAFGISAFSLAWKVNAQFLVAIPRNGGTLTEGVMGLPRFANPLLAVTDGDKDITALVYSGLMRHMPDGTIVPDIAESYTMSSDGKTYTFKLKQNVVFHDDTPVTADDLIFTIEKAQDPAIKSVKRANWEGTLVEKINDYEVKFTLPQPYAPFLENTTLGILPKHAWKDVSAEAFPLHDLNISPVGSGPFRVKSIQKNPDNTPHSYELISNKKFILGAPKIDRIVIKFYQNEKALVDAYGTRDVDAINSFTPESAAALEQSGATLAHNALPRTFAVFFNGKENPVLSELAVRKALDASVNKEYIVNTVLLGFAEPLAGPVSESLLNGSSSTPLASTTDRIAVANDLLDKAGWKPNANGIREKKDAKGLVMPLAFSISTSNAPELTAIAEILKAEWRKVGAEVSVKIFEGGHLNQNIIRPRRYDALLFGQVVNRNLDLYAFWHSSQRTDPGLNIAQYSNAAVDTMLERIRTVTDRTRRSNEFRNIAATITRDVPAVFLYSPDFIYTVPKQVHGMTLGTISTPSERFADVHKWYIDTDYVWKVFAPKN